MGGEGLPCGVAKFTSQGEERALNLTWFRGEDEYG